MQAAWILTLPPFRGTDEFDHAYRAASVADGAWKPLNSSTVIAPETLVRAAHPVCASYEYTSADNCSPIRRLGDGRVEVLSRAANYNPMYYWIVGTAASPFKGNASLYTMRIASSVLCAILVAVACWVTSLWSRTRWPIYSILVALTPVVLFSISIVAPNGLEMAASLCLWMALLGLCTHVGRTEHARALLLVTGVSSVVVATLRSLGPLWILMIAVTGLCVLGLRPFMGIVRKHYFLMTGALVAVTGAAALAGSWTRTMGTQTLTPFDMGDIDPLTSTLEQIPLWFLQGVAAFPRRGDPAPLAVYVLVGVVYIGLICVGLVTAGRRTRLVILACLAVAVALPAVFTYRTIGYAGPIWQGRYGLPFHMGVALLAGLALDRYRIARSAREIALIIATCTTLALANGVAILHVLARERMTSPLRLSSAWVSAPSWALLALVAAGFVAWALAIVSARVGAEDAEPAEVAEAAAQLGPGR
jgi:hypothetical protein